MSNIIFNISEGGFATPFPIPYSYLSPAVAPVAPVAAVATTTMPPITTTMPPITTTMPPITTTMPPTTPLDNQAELAKQQYIEALQLNEQVKKEVATPKPLLDFSSPQTKMHYMRILVIWIFAFILIFLFQFCCVIMPRFPCGALVALVLIVATSWTIWLVFMPTPPKS